MPWSELCLQDDIGNSNLGHTAGVAYWPTLENPGTLPLLQR
jgi:hypothetical protein